MVGHGHGNLPSGHRRTTSTKTIAKIKTTNHAGRKCRSTGIKMPSKLQHDPQRYRHLGGARPLDSCVADFGHEDRRQVARVESGAPTSPSSGRATQERMPRAS
jgi:hypothetical protein